MSVEIDRLVAEKIMGTPWRRPTHGNCCTCQRCGYSHADFDQCKCGYSDFIERAWEVVEQMKARGWHTFLGTIIDDQGERWQADFTKWHQVGDDGADWRVLYQSNERAAEMPLAICLAALKAIDSEVSTALG